MKRRMPRSLRLIKAKFKVYIYSFPQNSDVNVNNSQVLFHLFIKSIL